MALPLAQQANACEVLSRVLSGAVSPTKREKEHLSEQIKAAGITLRWLQMNEATVRAAVEARSP